MVHIFFFNNVTHIVRRNIHNTLKNNSDIEINSDIHEHQVPGHHSVDQQGTERQQGNKIGSTKSY